MKGNLPQVARRVSTKHEPIFVSMPLRISDAVDVKGVENAAPTWVVVRLAARGRP